MGGVSRSPFQRRGGSDARSIRPPRHHCEGDVFRHRNPDERDGPEDNAATDPSLAVVQCSDRHSRRGDESRHDLSDREAAESPVDPKTRERQIPGNPNEDGEEEESEQIPSLCIGRTKNFQHNRSQDDSDHEEPANDHVGGARQFN